MSRRRQRSRRPTEPPPRSEPSAKPPAAPPSRTRRWLFRALALLLIPGLAVAAELALRLAGYGRDTRFFLPHRIGNREALIPNDLYGLNFFPPDLARSPTPWARDLAKPTNTTRIFLFGESAALGDPRPAYGFGRYLEVLLEERFPGSRFEVIPAAMTAINSHALRRMAREALRYQGDLWIVYMGHNEMAGPFGAMTVFGRPTPPLPLVRLRLALQSSRLAQYLTANLQRWFPEPRPAESWGGLRMFLNQQLAPQDPARARVQDHFQANLRDLVAAGTARQIPLLLATPAANLTDCPPFASLHPPQFSATDSNHCAQLLASSTAALVAGDITHAWQQLQNAQALDPAFAAVRYHQGLCALALTNHTAALEHLAAARDADALPFRTDGALLRIVRETAREFAAQGAQLVDLESLLSADRPPGNELFFDHVHFNPDGNYRVARRLAESLEPRLPAAVNRATARAWADQEQVERRLALTDWNRARILEGMLQRLLEPPFSGQWNHAGRLAALSRQLADLRQQLHPRRHLDTQDLYREAIAQRPDDPRLHENAAEFYEATGNTPDAIAEWRRVADLLPYHYAPWFQLGRLQAGAGQFPAARSNLQQCLALRPNLAEATLELAQLAYRQTNHLESIRLLTALRERAPTDPRVLRYLADPLAALGRRAEALDCLKQAIDLRPAYWEARYLLGVELGLDNHLLDARAQFEEVLRLRPDHVLAHLNLGVVHARLGHAAPARTHFEEVLRLEPQNAKARQFLAELDRLSTPTAPAPLPP